MQAFNFLNFHIDKSDSGHRADGKPPCEYIQEGLSGDSSRSRFSGRRALQKLRGRAGDTLVETIAAILIVALASVMLLSAAAAAATANKKIMEADKVYAADMEAAESMTSEYTSPTGELTIKSEGKTVATVNIKYFGTENGKLLSYKKAD